MTLHEYLSENFNISKTEAKKTIKQGFISLNGQVIKKNIYLDISRDLNIEFNKPKSNFEYELSDYLIEQNSDIISFYKPPFMHSEGIFSNSELALSHIVKENFPGYNLISRLDFETDGVLLAVKDGFKIETLEKLYYCVVEGFFYEEVEIDNKIDAHKRKQVEVLEAEETQEEGYLTKFVPSISGMEHSLVAVLMEKATRHQIRAYSSYMGFPIVGDKLYGKDDEDISKKNRLMLHSAQITINGKTYVSGKEEQFIDEARTIINSL